MSKALKNAYDMINFIKGFCREHNTPLEKMGDFIKEQRREIRRINAYSVDPLEKSMRDEWRHVYSADGEDGYDYRILPDNGKTEEEIEAMIEETIGYGPVRGPYDCTGKRFTRWISAKRVPAGFAVIHSWGLDV